MCDYGRVLRYSFIYTSMQAIFTTTMGEFTVLLDEAATPNTVANFVKLAKSGFYDGVNFHRVIAGFMVQGGDPLTKEENMRTFWGTGGPGYTFDDEITAGNSNVMGTISMANAGPNTNGSQFFINCADNVFLDRKHTVFGHVASGMDVVEMIEGVPVDGSDKPVQPVVIEKITIS